MFETKVVEKVKTHFMLNKVFFFSKIVSGAGHILQYGACVLHAAYLRLHTHTHSEYVILIAFPLQQRLHERTLMLRYT